MHVTPGKSRHRARRARAALRHVDGPSPPQSSRVPSRGRSHKPLVHRRCRALITTGSPSPLGKASPRRVEDQQRSWPRSARTWPRRSEVNRLCTLIIFHACGLVSIERSSPLPAGSCRLAQPPQAAPRAAVGLPGLKEHRTLDCVERFERGLKTNPRADLLCPGLAWTES